MHDELKIETSYNLHVKKIYNKKEKEEEKEGQKGE